MWTTLSWSGSAVGVIASAFLLRAFADVKSEHVKRTLRLTPLGMCNRVQIGYLHGIGLLCSYPINEPPMWISTGAQIRAARALLDWTQHDLADAAGLHVNSVSYWECQAEFPSGLFREPVACRQIRQVLARAGVKFLSDPAPGVQLRGKATITPPQRAAARTRASSGIIVEEIVADITPANTLGPSQPINKKPGARCGAKTRSGQACRRPGLGRGGRCANHGGASTGPRSDEGRKRIALAQKKRWARFRAT